MKHLSLWLWTLAILVTGPRAASAATETNAVIPYASLAEMVELIETIDQTKLTVQLFIAAKNKAVAPGDIVLAIQSPTRGAVPVPLATNGLVAKFPIDEKLRRENPPIRSNQPKGTLNLNVELNIPLPENLTFRYERLQAGAAEMNKVIKAKAGMLSWLAPKASGVVFQFPKARAGQAKVEIRSAKGRTEYLADKDGQVKLKLEKALLTENPELQVSEKPKALVPDFD